MDDIDAKQAKLFAFLAKLREHGVREYGGESPMGTLRVVFEPAARAAPQYTPEELEKLQAAQEAATDRFLQRVSFGAAGGFLPATRDPVEAARARDDRQRHAIRAAQTKLDQKGKK